MIALHARLARLGWSAEDVPADDVELLLPALANLPPGTLRPDEGPLVLDLLAQGLNVASRAHYDAMHTDDPERAQWHVVVAVDLIIAVTGVRAVLPTNAHVPFDRGLLPSARALASEVLRTLTQLPTCDLVRDTRQALAAVADDLNALATAQAQADAAAQAQLQQTLGDALTAIATHHGAAEEAAQRGSLLVAHLQWCSAAEALITAAQALDARSLRDPAQVDALLGRFGPWLRAIVMQVQDGLERSGVTDAEDQARLGRLAAADQLLRDLGGY